MPSANARRCWRRLALPAYDQCIKASHLFNLLDARGVISVAERASYIGRVRDWRKPVRKPGCRGLPMPEFFIEIFSEEIPARMQAVLGRNCRGFAGRR